MELEIYTRFTFRSPVAPSADHIASATSAGLAVLGPTLRRLWSFRHCAKRQRSDQTGRGGLPGLRALVAVAAQRPGRCRWWETFGGAKVMSVYEFECKGCGKHFEV